MLFYIDLVRQTLVVSTELVQLILFTVGFVVRWRDLRMAGRAEQRKDSLFLSEGHRPEHRPSKVCLCELGECVRLVSARIALGNHSQNCLREPLPELPKGTIARTVLKGTVAKLP